MKKRRAPLISLNLLERVLVRQILDPTPERRLIASVLVCAINDCRSNVHHLAHEARQFILGPRVEPYADLAGINPEFVREVAVKAGYLVQ